jgi:hypothetical protein
VTATTPPREPPDAAMPLDLRSPPSGASPRDVADQPWITVQDGFPVMATIGAVSAAAVAAGRSLALTELQQTARIIQDRDHNAARGAGNCATSHNKPAAAPQHEAPTP